MAGTRKGRGRGGRVRAVYGRVKTKGENTFGGRLGVAEQGKGKGETGTRIGEKKKEGAQGGER